MGGECSYGGVTPSPSPSPSPWPSTTPSSRSCTDIELNHCAYYSGEGYCQTSTNIVGIFHYNSSVFPSCRCIVSREAKLGHVHGNPEVLSRSTGWQYIVDGPGLRRSPY